MKNNPCDRCSLFHRALDPCLGVHGNDGYYTYGTPLFESDREKMPGCVFDAIGAVSADEDGDPICCQFKRKIMDTERLKELQKLLAEAKGIFPKADSFDVKESPDGSLELIGYGTDTNLGVSRRYTLDGDGKIVEDASPIY